MIDFAAAGWRKRIHPAALIAIVFCTAWIAFIAPRATGDRGQWAATSLPLFKDVENMPVLSFTEIVDGYAIQRENIPTFRGVAMLEGAALSASFYHVRVLYNFFASLLAPFFGVITSFLILNLMAWAGMTYLSWRFARSLAGNPWAGALSAALTAGSMGFVVHVSDFSAHLLAAATYFGGIVAIHESEVWKRRRRFSIHLGLGVYLAIAAIAYNTGIMLCLVYLLLAWRKNAIQHVGAAFVVGLAAEPIWTHILDFIATAPVPPVESGQITHAMHLWLDGMSTSPIATILEAIKFVSENVTIDSPLIVPFALVAILISPVLAGRRLFLLVAVLMPMAMLLPWRPISTGTVAYTILGLVPVLHAALAGSLVEPMVTPHRRWAIPTAIIVLAVQLVWSTSMLRGWVMPIHASVWGPYAIGGLWTTQPIIESLTGAEPTPHLFGGTATFIQAGLASVPADILDTGFNPFAALIAKAYPSLLIGALIFILTRPGRMRAWALGGFGALVACSSLAAPMTHIMPPPYTFRETQAVRLDAGETTTYRVKVSTEFVNQLAALPPDAETLVYVGIISGPCTFAVSVHGRAIGTSNVQNPVSHDMLAQIDRQELTSALRAGGDLEITLHPTGATALSGWQRSDLPGRAINHAGPIFPSIEVRATAPDGTLLLDGF